MEITMQIFIQSTPFNMTHSLRGYVEKKIRNSLGRRSEDVQRIHVRLSDINGPNGGVDKRCHIHLKVRNMADIVIEHTRDDLYDAIGIACVKAKSSLNRRLARQKLVDRSSLVMFRKSLLQNSA
jgi:ribosomal subunit interface protein